MSKKVEVQEMKGSPIKRITESLNKHGEIKGSSKKETKILRGLCVHHKYNKKGKIVAEIVNDGEGTCTCLMCRHEFTTKLPTMKELDEIVDEMIKLNDQAKFMAVSVDAGDETIKYLAAMGVQLMNYKKTYSKLKSIAERQETIKNGKKKKSKGKDNFGSGSGNYGSWGSSSY